MADINKVFTQTIDNILTESKYDPIKMQDIITIIALIYDRKLECFQINKATLNKTQEIISKHWITIQQTPDLVSFKQNSIVLSANKLNLKDIDEFRKFVSSFVA